MSHNFSSILESEVANRKTYWCMEEEISGGMSVTLVSAVCARTSETLAFSFREPAALGINMTNCDCIMVLLQ